MSAPDTPLNLAIAATFSAGPIEPPLAFWMEELDLPAQIALAPYNQPFQQLLDPSSLLAMNVHGVNIVLLRLEDWRAEDTNDWRGDLRQKVTEFIAALAASLQRTSVSWLLAICPASPA